MDNSTGKGTTFRPMDQAAVAAKMAVPPLQVVDLKAMAGDKSDNYDGIAGIGQVYAQKLLAACGDLDGIFTAAEVGDGKSGACVCWGCC